MNLHDGTPAELTACFGVLEAQTRYLIAAGEADEAVNRRIRVNESRRHRIANSLRTLAENAHALMHGDDGCFPSADLVGRMGAIPEFDRGVWPIAFTWVQGIRSLELILKREELLRRCIENCADLVTAETTKTLRAFLDWLPGELATAEKVQKFYEDMLEKDLRAGAAETAALAREWSDADSAWPD